MQWSTSPRIVAADRGSQFAFVVPDPLGRDTTRWTYRLEESGDGTELTESFELLRTIPGLVRLLQKYLMGARDRKADLEANMRETLESIKSAAEARGA